MIDSIRYHRIPPEILIQNFLLAHLVAQLLVLPRPLEISIVPFKDIKYVVVHTTEQSLINCLLQLVIHRIHLRAHLSKQIIRDLYVPLSALFKNVVIYDLLSMRSDLIRFGLFFY